MERPFSYSIVVGLCLRVHINTNSSDLVMLFSTFSLSLSSIIAFTCLAYIRKTQSITYACYAKNFTCFEYVHKP
jgi:hypothetical protein